MSSFVLVPFCFRGSSISREETWMRPESLQVEMDDGKEGEQVRGAKARFVNLQ